MKPGSFSLRTLEKTRNLTQSEAIKFQQIVTFVVKSDNNFLIYNDSSISKKFNIDYSDILLLEECGLITSSPLLSYKKQVLSYQKTPLLRSNERICIVTNNNTSNLSITFPTYTLTFVGSEIFSILSSQCNTDYFEDII
ncbi:MAG: DUF2806 domain-containing protein [Deltaproteobacteria bacterium]|nr:DUF2806 domain-containing protein [Deltaproteobacteria bacterium]